MLGCARPPTRRCQELPPTLRQPSRDLHWLWPCTPPSAPPCRNLQGRRKHRLWEPVLQDPPPLLDNVCVVLVSPKRPISVGTVARSLSCFECEDLRIVDPQCDHLTRSSRNGSKGAQFLLWRAQQPGSLEEALADCELSVACTRWVAGKPAAHVSASCACV